MRPEKNLVKILAISFEKFGERLGVIFNKPQNSTFVKYIFLNANKETESQLNNFGGADRSSQYLSYKRDSRTGMD